MTRTVVILRWVVGLVGIATLLAMTYFAITDPSPQRDESQPTWREVR